MKFQLELSIYIAASAFYMFSFNQIGNLKLGRSINQQVITGFEIL